MIKLSWGTNENKIEIESGIALWVMLNIGEHSALLEISPDKVKPYFSPT